MSLEARTTEPGLWVNPAWQAGTPGTFAVVIGVSAYPHLAGGEAKSLRPLAWANCASRR